MKFLEPGDYVIWQRKRICRVLNEVPAAGTGFSSFLPPVLDIRPAGITDSDYAALKNMTTTWRVKDDRNEEEFDASGVDLLYVNEMQLLAIMASLKDRAAPADGLSEQKEE